MSTIRVPASGKRVGATLALTAQVRIATLATAIGIFATAALTWAAHRHTQVTAPTAYPASTEPAPVH